MVQLHCNVLGLVYMSKPGLSPNQGSKHNLYKFCSVMLELSYRFRSQTMELHPHPLFPTIKPTFTLWPPIHTSHLVLTQGYIQYVKYCCHARCCHSNCHIGTIWRSFSRLVKHWVTSSMVSYIMKRIRSWVILWKTFNRS